MNPEISEFSYGYAITEELIHVHVTPITAAPVFPTLYQEGQIGGGYDVEIRGPAVPLFIQFKLCHCLTTRNAALVKTGDLTIPYYRMNLMPRRHSRQHQLLLDLESAGNDVYYCAPGFYEKREFDNAYRNQQVCNRSIWLMPSNIGSLPDQDDHYVAFKQPTDGYFYFCSDPREITASIDFGAVYKRLVRKLVSISDGQMPKVDFAKIAKDVIEKTGYRDLLSVTDNALDSRIDQLPPVAQLAAVSSRMLASQLYIATLSQETT